MSPHPPAQPLAPAQASVPAPQITRWADVPAQPWRNGGGITRELMAWPPGEHWQLRLSVAEIGRSGPFSAFPGVTRWFAVMTGPGVLLGLPSGPLTLRPGDAPCVFDGADAPGCELLGGATQDLNLMLQRAEGELCPAVAGQAWRPGQAQCGLFTREALQVMSPDAPPLALPAMSLCWWPLAPGSLTLAMNPGTPPAASATAWWISFSPLSEDPLR